MEESLGDSGFDQIGKFLQIFFYNPTCRAEDPHSVSHGWVVAQFLRGRNKIKMADIIDLIYSHKHSARSSRSTQSHKCHAPFSPSVTSSEIFHVCPSLFTWTVNLVANHIHQEMYDLTSKDNNVHLQISTNGQHADHCKLGSSW